MTTQTHPAGIRRLAVADPMQGAAIDTFVFYPAAQAGGAFRHGAIDVDATPDAPAAPGAWPLLALSHGNAGAPLLYRTIALHLARHGYVVALPAHPGNTHGDNKLAGTAENLENRPRHVRLALDAVQAAPWLDGALRDGPVGLIGHSLGGYTVLALAGAQGVAPEGQPLATAADPRVATLALLAPAAGYFRQPGALDAVRVPILMLDAEHDVHTPRWHAQVVRDGIAAPAQLEWRTPPGSGHYSFLSPYPEAQRKMGLAPASDPPGFDREAFHRSMPEELRLFFDRTLK